MFVVCKYIIKKLKWLKMTGLGRTAQVKMVKYRKKMWHIYKLFQFIKKIEGTQVIRLIYLIFRERKMTVSGILCYHFIFYHN